MKDGRIRKMMGKIGAAAAIFASPAMFNGGKAAYAVEQAMQDPKIVLPSQEAYAARVAELADPNFKPLPLRVVTHPAFIGGAGIVAAGGVGYMLYQNVEKKKAEQLRQMLSQKSGIEIDASILDDPRINRPGAKTFQYTNAPQFGTYRAPPEKLVKDVRDKYNFKKSKKLSDEELEKMAKDQTNMNFKTNSTKQASGSSATVELVGEFDGPKTGDEKEREKIISDFSMDDLLNKGMQNPGEMDPEMMAAALPMLQAQLSEVLKEGVSPEEVAEVKRSFKEMGINLEDMFRSIDEMEKSGLANSLGKEGLEFFKTLRKILETPTK
ncbi:hypothetical protein GUITHDRAFT_101565 [Guillardia theta CCMP2712]|uniref:Uncharacterized protein n=1 Tax=Guillardia theta (strain CCMP2712) TaxID=905079 RepID=L1JYF7_GUITC|nr:hypothetical protein GUITHDRAFT_101565 [Guillardia theta CCMP2712]EKX53128.1 hypothetical protein GUITHDRAFT_101565 [Guillardia theta CCMP2712]|eukprot:XP_005840108.1 hypothetical protein GUITHDRAFT_101565 [Guillardia theta CCMP2712]